MKRIGFVFLLIVVSFTNALACLNNLMLKDHTVITADNSYAMDSGYDGIPTGHRFIESQLTVALKRLDSLWKATHDIDYYSDYALVLILQGKYEEAKNSYLEIERIKPGCYETASNLGTVYELLGDDKNALKWIKKAIKINPDSHYGSEWLHVKILEAKIKGEAFVTSDFLLNTNFGTDTIPQSKLTENELKKLKATLVYQLNERMTFVKPKNQIVALLLFDLGNVLTLLESQSNAAAVYDMADKYGYSDSLLGIRLDYFTHEQTTISTIQPDCTLIISKPPLAPITATETHYTLFFILEVCICLLSICAFLFFERKKNESAGH